MNTVSRRCNVASCNNPAPRGIRCSEHYSRWYTYGGTIKDESPPVKRPATTPPSSQTKVCQIEGCSSVPKGRGYCAKHYSRWSRHGDPLGMAVTKNQQPCLVDGCESKYRGRGYCNRHYQAFLNYGDPLGTKARAQAKKKVQA